MQARILGVLGGLVDRKSVIFETEKHTCMAELLRQLGEQGAEQQVRARVLYCQDTHAGLNPRMGTLVLLLMLLDVWSTPWVATFAYLVMTHALVEQEAEVCTTSCRDS